MTLRRVLTGVMHGIGFAFDQLATESQLEVVASKWMRELDLALHPWGEPGLVPTDEGNYWGTTGDPGDKPVAMVLTPPLPSGDRAWVQLHRSDEPMTEDELQQLAADHGLRFRRRWAPGGPVTP